MIIIRTYTTMGERNKIVNEWESKGYTMVGDELINNKQTMKFDNNPKYSKSVKLTPISEKDFIKIMAKDRGFKIV